MKINHNIITGISGPPYNFFFYFPKMAKTVFDLNNSLQKCFATFSSIFAFKQVKEIFFVSDATLKNTKKKLYLFWIKFKIF